jgi:protein TonB
MWHLAGTLGQAFPTRAFQTDMYWPSVQILLVGDRYPTSVTCRGYRACLVWNSMPLRCLLFSSNEEMVQPIWQVLTDLGIEGEYCRSAVDAVERVTTQQFQIVITDWGDQPEAAFLLKTARDQKASLRPLTLAIVSDDARLPEALRAGANSVLVKPIRPEQVRDTMSTACELLRAKQPTSPRPVELAAQPASKDTAVMSAAAGAASASVSVSSPASQLPEKTFRAGEFLQSSGPAPGAQFVTESEVQKSLDHVTASDVDVLTELEPMAGSVESAPPPPANPRKALDGWASLQARLTRPNTLVAAEPPPQGDLLRLGETIPLESTPSIDDQCEKKQSQQETESEAALFSYMSGEANESTLRGSQPRSKRSAAVFLSMLAVACVVLVAIPRTRRSLGPIFRNTTHAGRNLLNPPPVQVPQTITQHETFGQDSEEYKLPLATSIPDATTDPSQIRVLPVLDPTAKPTKGSEPGSVQAPGENVPTTQSQNGSGDSGQQQIVGSEVKEPTTSGAGDMAIAAPGGSPATVPELANPPATPETTAPQRPAASPPQRTSPPRAIQLAPDAAIPSSLRSQMGSGIPEASGNKPAEAAMSSIEPVNLPESAAWGLLIQPIDPVYPDSAKGNGQRGSVVLQVLIGRDGTVQDAKFLQGSLIFARAAIDAVKQGRFKPYLMNGRAVSVQSVITLNFKPPA